MNVTNMNAANAYRDASRIAERILKETQAEPASTAKESGGASFMGLVGNALEGAAATGYKSEALATKALSGKADVTSVVAAIANAEIALNTIVAVRDRAISAYQDIIKMPI